MLLGGFLFLGILTDVFVVSAQVKLFVTGLFSLNQDIPAFKEHLRDFLVQIKVCWACFSQEIKNNLQQDIVGKLLGTVEVVLGYLRIKSYFASF